MQTKIATVEEFLNWAKEQGEFSARLKTHRTWEVGGKTLKNRSRRNGAPCPWEYVDVKSSLPIRLGQEIRPSEIVGSYNFVDKYADLAVISRKNRQMCLTYFAEGPASYRYFNEGQEIEFAQLEEWWFVKPFRPKTGPVVIHRSYTPFDSVDAVTLGDTEWELIHTG